MSETHEVLAKFARLVSVALSDLASELEESVPQFVLAGTEELPEVRGHRQREILSQERLTTEEGMKTSEISNAIKYDQPNVYLTLQALKRAGLVELVEEASPQRWRLALRYRANVEAFKRIASLVGVGEWTTDGDISVAIRDDTKAARGVRRAVASLTDFPNPHRILFEGGQVQVSDEWRDALGRGVQEARKLLESEGVSFPDGQHADPAKRVAWDELRLRDSSP